MDSRVMELRIRRWIPIIEEQAKSGMNKNEWCTMHGIDRTSFFRWQKRVREYLLGQCKDQSSQFPSFTASGETGFVEIPSAQASLEELPRQIIYDLDVGGLDGQYGENNWRIVCWHQHKQLMKLDTPYYTQVVYTPVVSVGLEHDLFTTPYRNLLIDKSTVSCTIMADILYRKFVLGLPFYRQALDYRMQGISLGKQTIINWVNTLVPQVCEEVYESMTQQLVG